MGPNLEKRVDEAAIRSVIRPILLWQLVMSELVCCHGERSCISYIVSRRRVSMLYVSRHPKLKDLSKSFSVIKRQI